MSYDFRDNRTNYEKEKEVREKRLSAYSEDIQKRTLEQSCELIRQLVEERQRQGMTQQEVADITGIMPSNLARLESGKRAFTGKNARDLRTVSRLAFADAVIFPAGMLIVAYLGAGSAPLTLLITPLVTFCCLAAGIVLYVLSRLVADAAALREDNDLTI